MSSDTAVAELEDTRIQRAWNTKKHLTEIAMIRTYHIPRKSRKKRGDLGK